MKTDAGDDRLLDKSPDDLARDFIGAATIATHIDDQTGFPSGPFQELVEAGNQIP